MGAACYHAQWLLLAGVRRCCYHTPVVLEPAQRGTTGEWTCCNQHTVVLEPASEDGVNFCWNRPQFLLPSSSSFAGTNPFFVATGFVFAGTMYSFAATVFVFC
ncbi:hypothetical protein ACQJBY_060559 [Aegilops geniculata]